MKRAVQLAMIAICANWYSSFNSRLHHSKAKKITSYVSELTIMQNNHNFMFTICKLSLFKTYNLSRVWLTTLIRHKKKTNKNVVNLTEFYLDKLFFVFVAARSHASIAKLLCNCESRGESARAGKVPKSSHWQNMTAVWHAQCVKFL